MMNKEKKKYYRYMDYYDGSGMPKGYVFKYYTEDEAKHLGLLGLELIEVNETKGECNGRRTKIKCRR